MNKFKKILIAASAGILIAAGAISLPFIISNKNNESSKQRENSNNNNNKLDFETKFKNLVKQINESKNINETQKSDLNNLISEINTLRDKKDKTWIPKVNELEEKFNKYSVKKAELENLDSEESTAETKFKNLVKQINESKNINETQKSDLDNLISEINTLRDKKDKTWIPKVNELEEKFNKYSVKKAELENLDSEESTAETKFKNLVKQINESKNINETQKSDLDNLISEINTLKDKKYKTWIPKVDQLEEHFNRINQQNLESLKKELEEINKEREKTIIDLNAKLIEHWKNEDWYDRTTYLKDEEIKFVNKLKEQTLKQIVNLQDEANKAENQNIDKIQSFINLAKENNEYIKEWFAIFNIYKEKTIFEELSFNYVFLKTIDEYKQFMEELDKNLDEINKEINLIINNGENTPTVEEFKKYVEAHDNLKKIVDDEYHKLEEKTKAIDLKEELRKVVTWYEKSFPFIEPYWYVALTKDELFSRRLRDRHNELNQFYNFNIKSVYENDKKIKELENMERIKLLFDIEHFKKSVIESKDNYLKSKEYEDDEKFQKHKVKDPLTVFNYFKKWKEIIESEELKEYLKNDKYENAIQIYKKDGKMVPVENGEYEIYWKLDDISIWENEKFEELKIITTPSDTNKPILVKKNRYRYLQDVVYKGRVANDADHYFIYRIYDKLYAWASQFISIWGQELTKISSLMIKPNDESSSQINKNIFNLTQEEFLQNYTREYLNELCKFADRNEYAIVEYIKEIILRKFEKYKSTDKKTQIDNYWRPKLDSIYNEFVKRDNENSFIKMQAKSADEILDFRKEFETWLAQVENN
ncbi:hypothetical protein [Mycoplasma tauri]|uniref:hypothetical protein n=1 Tax=Mycoplasma tauri TaxID=547987 RepID=UPI001CBFF60E|nr:hypothetical protein [Mycoplasma tauri]MBZ4218386.1 hypothetical protein [Mycoplasma tauri]